MRKVAHQQCGTCAQAFPRTGCANPILPYGVSLLVISLKQGQSHGRTRTCTLGSVVKHGAAMPLDHVTYVRQPYPGTGNRSRDVAGSVLLFEHVWQIAAGYAAPSRTPNCLAR